MSNLFDPTTNILAKSLDMYLLRHSVISDNIANANTPHFKARTVDFENQLQRAAEALEAGGEELVMRELATARPQIGEDPHAEMGNDLNTVDMDRQMAAMTKNDVKYASATQMVSKKFALLKYAISEGSDR